MAVNRILYIEYTPGDDGYPIGDSVEILRRETPSKTYYPGMASLARARKVLNGYRFDFEFSDFGYKGGPTITGHTPLAYQAGKLPIYQYRKI